jgi:hypothetical protein
MATITHPLFSEHATGALANAITYRNTNNQQTARRYTKPRRRASPLQLVIRSRTKLLTQLWPTLSPDQQASWQPQAERDNVTRLNAFYVTNWQRIKRGQPIIMTPNPPTNQGKLTFAPRTFAAWTFRSRSLAGGTNQ